MNSYMTLVETLQSAISEPDKLTAKIQQFQNLIWNEQCFFPNTQAEEILRTLAYDLDFFEPDAAKRSEDPSYYGETRASEEIRAALVKLSAPVSRPLTTNH